MDTDLGSVERWTVKRLVTLVPGSTPQFWLRTAIPALVEASVLVKIGRGWVGRRTAIEAALLSVNSQPAVAF